MKIVKAAAELTVLILDVKGRKGKTPTAVKIVKAAAELTVLILDVKGRKGKTLTVVKIAQAVAVTMIVLFPVRIPDINGEKIKGNEKVHSQEEIR